jgi:hypothetical protein
VNLPRTKDRDCSQTLFTFSLQFASAPARTNAQPRKPGWAASSASRSKMPRIFSAGVAYLDSRSLIRAWRASVVLLKAEGPRAATLRLRRGSFVARTFPNLR